MENIDPSKPLVSTNHHSIEEASKNPDQLVELFKKMSAESENISNPGFAKIFENIELLDSAKKFSEDQTLEIMEIASRIFPKVEDGKFKSSMQNFIGTHFDKIDASNVLTLLEYAKRSNAHEGIQKCLQFLQNQTGATYTFTNATLSL